MENKKEYRFNFYIEMLTRAIKDRVKNVLILWSEEHGLTKNIISKNLGYEGGWSRGIKRYIFGVYYDVDDGGDYVTLEKPDMRRECKKLVSLLKEVDPDIEVYIEWSSLEELFRAKAKVEKITKQLEEVKERLDYIDEKIKTYTTTRTWEELLEVFNEGSEKELEALLAKKRHQSHFSDG